MKDLFDDPKNVVEETIQIIEISSFDENIFGKKMRGYYAIIHASKDAVDSKRNVYFMFNNMGQKIIAKDLDGHVAFKLVKEEEKVQTITEGKTYDVTVNQYMPAQTDGYALLEIEI